MKTLRCFSSLRISDLSNSFALASFSLLRKTLKVQGLWNDVSFVCPCAFNFLFAARHVCSSSISLRCRRLFLMGNLFFYFYDSVLLSLCCFVHLFFQENENLFLAKEKRNEKKKRKENFLMRKFSWVSCGGGTSISAKKNSPVSRLKKWNWKRCKDIPYADAAFKMHACKLRKDLRREVKLLNS